MNILCVYAYDNPRSFGAAIHNRVLRVLEAAGHSVRVIDLYAAGFRAIPVKWDFATYATEHTNYMHEQKRSSKQGLEGFSEDIRAHIEMLRDAECLIVEFPLWWSAPPAIVKGWFDKVFAMGIAWDEDQRYSKGLLRGKQAMVITGAGDDEQLYQPDGLHGATVLQHLYPLLHSTLAQAGMDVLLPFIVTGLNKAPEAVRLERLDQLDAHLEQMLQKPSFIYRHR